MKMNRQERNPHIGPTRNRPGERGQGMLEYVLIVVFVAIAGIAVWRSFGQQIVDLVQGSASKISGGTEGMLDSEGE